jgi:DNA polymerase-3 subunit delta'
MSWESILGHNRVRQQFALAMANDRLASTFLFLGPDGIGKRIFALKLAQTLLCPRASDFHPCGVCPSCRQLLAGEHPDFEYLCRLPDRNQIILEQLIGEKGDREGFCHSIAKKPFYGGRKVAILDDADDLRHEGANALLKTLEEPPPNSIIILIGTAEQRQLPTIRSRCQIVRFQPLNWEDVLQILLQKELVSPPDIAERLARSSGGSVQNALHLFGEDVLDFRLQWLEHLASGRATAEAFVKSMQSFVDRAGKESTPKRRRLIQVAAWAAEYFRQTLAVLANGRLTSTMNEYPDQELIQLAISGAQQWRGTLESMTVALDRCLMVESQVMANAHVAALIESWLLDLNQAAQAKIPFYPSLATISPLAYR